MANDNDFLNQKIIPVEENLGDNNNEHKQIALYCPQGWHKQKGLSQGVRHTDRSRTREWTTVPPFLLHPMPHFPLLRKVSGTAGCREGLIHGHCIHLQSHSTALTLAQQNWHGRECEPKQSVHTPWRGSCTMERRIYSLAGCLHGTPDTQGLPLLC